MPVLTTEVFDTKVSVEAALFVIIDPPPTFSVRPAPLLPPTAEVSKVRLRPPVKDSVLAVVPVVAPSVAAPTTSVVPAPVKVPLVQAKVLVKVRDALPPSVPPETITGPNVEFAVMLNVPPVTANVVVEFVLRLRTVRFPEEKVTVPEPRLITASSFGPGTTPPSQLLAVVKRLSPITRLFQVIVESTTRSSRYSRDNALERARLRAASASEASFIGCRCRVKMLMSRQSCENDQFEV